MRKSVKIFWGLITLLPVALLLLAVSLFLSALASTPEAASLAPTGVPGTLAAALVSGWLLFLLALGLGFLVKISYFIHLVRADHLGKDAKTLWAVLFPIFSLPAMAVYWVLHVWPQPEPTSSGAPPSVPRRPRRRSVR